MTEYRSRSSRVLLSLVAALVLVWATWAVVNLAVHRNQATAQALRVAGLDESVSNAAVTGVQLVRLTSMLPPGFAFSVTVRGELDGRVVSSTTDVEVLPTLFRPAGMDTRVSGWE